MESADMEIPIDPELLAQGMSLANTIVYYTIHKLVQSSTSPVNHSLSQCLDQEEIEKLRKLLKETTQARDEEKEKRQQAEDERLVFQMRSCQMLWKTQFSIESLTPKPTLNIASSAWTVFTTLCGSTTPLAWICTLMTVAAPTPTKILIKACLASGGAVTKGSMTLDGISMIELGIDDPEPPDPDNL